VGVSLPVHAMDHMETARMIMHAAHALDNTQISWNPRDPARTYDKRVSPPLVA